MNNHLSMEITNESTELETTLKNDERKENFRLLWIFACFFCPSLIEIVVNDVVQITVENWQRVYVTKLLFCIAFPLMTAFLLAFIVRWKSKFLALSLIICLTAVPVATSYWTILDLYEGKIVVGGVYKSFDYGVYNKCFVEETNIYTRHYELPCSLNVPSNQLLKLTLLPNTQRVIKVEKYNIVE